MRRTTTTVTVPPPVALGRDTRKRAEARAALAAVIWERHGARRLPSDRELVAAMAACDPRDVWWVCEASSAGPVYFLPTREWVRAFAKAARGWQVHRILEVGAGDGFLSACLQEALPEMELIATDSGAWGRAAARMSAKDKREYRGVAFQGIEPSANVQKLDAVTAVKRYKPDLTLVVWPPPGDLLERVIKAPSHAVLDISVEGDVCGLGMLTWRFNKDFLFGPLEDKALCRLDSRPTVERHTRVTLYYGRAHPEFHEEKDRFKR